MANNQSRKDQPRKDQQRGPKISLALMPIEISEKEIKISMELYNSGVERIVRFSLNGLATVDAIKTTVGKSAEHVFQIPSNTIEASIKAETIGEPKVWDEIKIALTPPAKKNEKERTRKGIPADLEVKAEGQNGKYYINMQIVDADNIGIKGEIRVITNTGKIDLPTDEKGVVFEELKLRKSQEVRFLVLGTKIDKKLSLLGPDKPTPRCPATPQNATGLFSGLGLGWKARKRRG